jgi:siroheme synthase-like protein
MSLGYPVILALAGRPAVVIGGGEVAERRARELLEAGARVTIVAETFTAGLEELARGEQVVLVQRPYAFGDLEGAFIAIATTGDPTMNAEIFQEAEQRRVLLNAVDDVEHCHFAAPSVVRRGELVMTISAEPRIPEARKHLRLLYAAFPGRVVHERGRDGWPEGRGTTGVGGGATAARGDRVGRARCR